MRVRSCSTSLYTIADYRYLVQCTLYSLLYRFLSCFLIFFLPTLRFVIFQERDLPSFGVLSVWGHEEVPGGEEGEV